MELVRMKKVFSRSLSFQEEVGRWKQGVGSGKRKSSLAKPARQDQSDGEVGDAGGRRIGPPL